jgi:hypothetical protein
LAYTVLPHHSEMDGIARGKLPISQDKLLGFFDGFSIYWKNLIHERQKSIESGLDYLATVDGGVTVEDLLKDLRIGYQPLPAHDRFFEQPLSLDLVRVRGAHNIHGHIGVDKNHGLWPLR